MDPIGIIVLHNEGERARSSLEALKRVASKIIVLHDGPPNLETARIVNELNLSLLPMEKTGFKELQLVRYFESVKHFVDSEPWYLHVDSDEILSEELIDSIRGIKLDNNFHYLAKLKHVCDDGVALRYSEGSSRVWKPILFQLNKNIKVIGIPHKGLLMNCPVKIIRGDVEHRAIHLQFSLKQIFSREMTFVKKDARARASQMEYFSNGNKLKTAASFDNLPYRDWLLYKFPFMVAIPSLLYASYLAIRSLSEVRSFRTFVCEIKLAATLPIYYFLLPILIARIKRQTPSL